MEQDQTINLLKPAGKLSTVLPDDAAERTVANPFSIRPAEVTDVSDMEDVERLAFPTLFPPTRFRREIQRSNTLYLLSVREWTREEIEDAARDSDGIMKRVASVTGALLFQRIGGRQRKRAEQYVAGFVGLWYVLDEAHVVIIGIRPEDRRKGLGELLLISALEAAMKQGSRIVTLEVRASNQAARTLYRKYGFQEVGVRKRYYADNNEDAVIMTTPPIQGDEYWEHFHEQVRNHAARWGETERRIS